VEDGEIPPQQTIEFYVNFIAANRARFGIGES
jgi:hypothetical protein